MAGRPRKPSALKVLQGTQRKDRVNKNEPKPPAIKTPVPDYLSEIGKQAYAEFMEILHQMQIFTVADAPNLQQLVETWAEWRELNELVKKNGFTITQITAAGEPMVRPNPEVMMRSDASKRLRNLLTDFGMTPASRSKVSAQEVEQADPLEEFMARKRK